jgi:hypothetical protein
MAAVHEFSERVIDYAERLSDMADVAQGKHHRRVRTRRWLLLPATGAALYAVLRSDMFSRQAKEVVEEAKWSCGFGRPRAREHASGAASRGARARRPAERARRGGRRRRAGRRLPPADAKPLVRVQRGAE